jgi:hypothetical protein
MRRILMATAFVALAPLAYAQQMAPNSGNSSLMPPTASIHPAPGTASPAENCGTPDEPKPCPPLPKRNLPYYPENKR